MRGTGLSVADWRWTWLSLAIGILAVAVLIIPVVILYWPAKGVVDGMDWIGNQIWREHIALINRDIARKYGYARKPGAARPDRWLS
jgi:hypothetical protein